MTDTVNATAAPGSDAPPGAPHRPPESSADRVGEALDGLASAASSYRRLARIALLRKVVGARRMGVLLAFLAYGGIALAFLTLALILLLLWGASGLMASILDAPLWVGALVTGALGVTALTVLAVRFWRRQVRARIEYVRARLRTGGA